MTRCLSVATACLLVAGLASTARAQNPGAVAPQLQSRPARQEPARQLSRSIATGALVGAGLGAAGGAYWATFGEDGIVPEAAGVGAGLGPANGAIAGATIAMLPKPRGWRKHLLATAIGAAVSGATCMAFGEWAGQGTVRPGAAGTAGLAHGGLTALVTLNLTR